MNDGGDLDRRARGTRPMRNASGNRMLYARYVMPSLWVIF